MTSSRSCMLRPVFSILLLTTWACAASAQSDTGRRIQTSRSVNLDEMIDVPSAEVLDYGSFAVTSRFFSQGGLLASMSFGVFRRLMLGPSMEIDRYVGSGTTDLQRPELQFKFRFYDGYRYLPAAAIGFDSQGYRFEKSKDDYLEQERGLYLAFTEELFTSGMEITAGGNISDFEHDSLHGFTALSWVAQNTVGLFAEYDNLRSLRWNRLNAGLNLFVSPFVQVGFHVRDILGDKTYQDSDIQRKPERIIKLRYIGSF
ncbi:MAG: hypothetical protein AABZ44_07020 [Elusimicrobiota bacterium]